MKSFGCLWAYPLAIVSLMVIAAPALSDEIRLPHGWRAPTVAELGDAWREKDAEKFALVEGDFNGDGVADKAMLLVSKENRSVGLFVFMSQAKGKFKTYQLSIVKDASSLQANGISKALPGKYKSACGKGYWQCKKGELSEISIETDAVNFFKSESAESYFYWDKHTGVFRRIWISD